MTTGNNSIRELSAQEIAHVSGGLLWTKGTKNDDVIDARGGQVTFGGLVISLGKDGKATSIRPK